MNALFCVGRSPPKEDVALKINPVYGMSTSESSLSRCVHYESTDLLCH